tara:strand:- start:33 stop:611 length:579 start_codon:yes stop_codon:yes gene_type:complete
MSFDFKISYSTPFFNIEKGHDSQYPNNQPYYRLTGVDSVICCVMTMQEEFVMVRQFRPNIDEYSLEFPAGGLLKNEKPLEAAKRELMEETCLSSDFLYLGDYRLMMNRTNIKEHLFFGINPRNTNQLTPERGIEVCLVKRQDLSIMSSSGRYKQLAGLGIIHLASNYLGLNIMSKSMDQILEKFKLKQNNDS